MLFDLNEDQRQLSDSLSRLLADQYSFEKRRAIAASAAGWSEASTQAIVELGLSALPIPEAQGGLGGAPVDLLPIFQAFGRALYIEPFLGSVVLCSSALLAAGTDEARSTHLPAIANGQTRFAWAHDEPASRHAAVWVETRATRTGESWRLSGAKSNVLHGASAQQLLVSARVAAEPGAREGIALFAVDPAAAGVDCRSFRLIDDSMAADIHFQNASATALTDPDDPGAGARGIDAANAYGIAAACADMVGCMEAAFRLAADYLKTRKQFGRLLGENQSLRHRAADMLVSLETSRSMAIAAFAALPEFASDESRLDLMRAKMLVGRHARAVCHSAIQMHGGIGMTEEYAVGHYLRRVHVLDQLFGDSAAHAARLAERV